MKVLVGVLGSEIGDLVLCFHKVDGDLTLLHYFLHKEVPQRDMLRARAVCAVAGTLPNPSLKPSSSIMLLQKTDSFMVSATTTKSASIVDCAVNP